MIASLLIPGFELRAALRKQPGLALRPAALAPLPGTEPLLGPVTTAAERLGVRPGMRLGEALATCPGLVLVEQDPAAAEQAWEEVLRALEDSITSERFLGPIKEKVGRRAQARSVPFDAYASADLDAMPLGGAGGGSP